MDNEATFSGTATSTGGAAVSASGALEGCGDAAAGGSCADVGGSTFSNAKVGGASEGRANAISGVGCSGRLANS